MRVGKMVSECWHHHQTNTTKIINKFICSSAQREWVENDLEQAGASAIKTVIRLLFVSKIVWFRPSLVECWSFLLCLLYKYTYASLEIIIHFLSIHRVRIPLPTTTTKCACICSNIRHSDISIFILYRLLLNMNWKPVPLQQAHMYSYLY